MFIGLAPNVVDLAVQVIIY